jgi:hypothetical protein
MGERQLHHDQFNYNAALADSGRRQLLLNLVRVRYLEAPFFLSVRSVLTQYVYTGNLGVSGASGEGTGFPMYSVGGDASVRYIERPTVTFAPLSGSDFVARLLRPIPGEQVAALARAGWPIDLMYTICLQQVNDITGLSIDSNPTEDDVRGARRLNRVSNLMIELFQRHAFEIRLENAELMLVFNETVQPQTQALVDEFKRDLGLDPNLLKFSVVANAAQRSRNEITLRFRSLLGVMQFLSYGVAVPEAHLAQKRVSELGLVATELLGTVPIAIRSSRSEPEDAFLAVEYAGHWFYIEQADWQSKETFVLLNYLYQLQAPEVAPIDPIVTIPAG